MWVMAVFRLQGPKALLALNKTTHRRHPLQWGSCSAIERTGYPVRGGLEKSLIIQASRTILPIDHMRHGANQSLDTSRDSGGF